MKCGRHSWAEWGETQQPHIRESSLQQGGVAWLVSLALTVFHWLTARLTGALGYTTQDVDDGYVVIDIERVL